MFIKNTQKFERQYYFNACAFFHTLLYCSAVPNNSSGDVVEHKDLFIVKKQSLITQLYEFCPTDHYLVNPHDITFILTYMSLFHK